VEARRRPGTASHPADYARKVAALHRSLLPEGWLEQVLKDQDERRAAAVRKAYMSNITIVEHEAELKELPQDILVTRLDLYTKGGPSPVSTRDRVAARSKRVSSQSGANLCSCGYASSLRRADQGPMYLDERGILSPANRPSFTHILNRPAPAVMTLCRLSEWIAMQLGRAAGFETPATSLVAMPDKMPPALSSSASTFARVPATRACLRWKICAPSLICRRVRSTTAL